MSRTRPSLASACSGTERCGASLLALAPGLRRAEVAMGEFCPSMTTPLALSDFDFALPPELIAQHPLSERSASRLLDGRADGPVERRFHDLSELLRAGDLLVVNDTAVIKARLLGFKASGGAVEALVERIEADGVALAHVRASKSPKPGMTIRFAD